MNSSAKTHLAILLLLTMALPAVGQRKEIDYTQKSIYAERQGKKVLSATRISRSSIDPVTDKEYYFEKYMDYRNNAFSLDTEYPYGSFEIHKDFGESADFRIRHTQYDTLRRIFSQVEIGVTEAGELILPRLTVEDEEESVWQYQLSPELIAYYEAWAQQHMDSTALQVIPAWPDTRSCEALLFSYDREHEFQVGDTLWTYKIQEKVVQGITEIDTNYIYWIERTEPATGMRIEIRGRGNRKSRLHSYSEIHFTPQMDSTHQYSYSISAGDTIHASTLITTLKSDTMYYHLREKQGLADWGMGRDTILEPIAERELYMIGNKKHQRISVVATGKTIGGMPVAENCSSNVNGHYACQKSTLLLERNGVVAARNFDLVGARPYDLKPLIPPKQLILPEYRKSRMRKFRNEMHVYSNRMKSRKYWKREIRSKYYGKWVRRDNPNEVQEVYYRRK